LAALLHSPALAVPALLVRLCLPARFPNTHTDCFMCLRLHRSFAAAGAMEGAWFRATGRRVSFSEQQILDCSWGFRPDQPYDNMGEQAGHPPLLTGSGGC